MAVSLTCTAVNQRNGKYYVRFSDKTELEFTSAQDARDHVRSILNDIDVKELLRAIMLAKALRPGAAASAVANLPGTVATVDLTLANVIRVA